MKGPEAKDLLIAYPEMFHNHMSVHELFDTHKERLTQLVTDGYVHPFDYFGHPNDPAGRVWTILGAAIYIQDYSMTRMLLPFAREIHDRPATWWQDGTRPHTCLQIAYWNDEDGIVLPNLLFDHGVDPFRERKLRRTVSSVTISNEFMQAARDSRFDSVLHMINRFHPDIDQVRGAIELMRFGFLANMPERVLEKCQSYIDATIAKDAACTALVWTCERGIGSEWRDMALIFGERFRLHTDLSGWGFGDDDGRPNKLRKI